MQTGRFLDSPTERVSRRPCTKDELRDLGAQREQEAGCTESTETACITAPEDAFVAWVLLCVIPSDALFDKISHA